MFHFQNSGSSPPGRGELNTFNAFGKWGGLLNSERNPEECDATDDASSTSVGVKNSLKTNPFPPQIPNS